MFTFRHTEKYDLQESDKIQEKSVWEVKILYKIFKNKCYLRCP